MSEVFIIIAVASVAYIGTNLDNLLLLAAMYSRYERHPGMVTAGYFTGMIIICVITLIVGEAGELIPLAYLGLLGVIPMMMGIFALWKLFSKTDSAENTGVTTEGARLTVFFTLITTQLSNSTDSIITFSALLADSSDFSDYVIVPTFLGMVAVFSWLAYYSVKHHKLSGFVARFGQYVTPFILILVGIYILSNTASDLVPG